MALKAIASSVPTTQLAPSGLKSQKTQSIRGVVRSPETGLPQAGIEVRLEHDNMPGLVVATTMTDTEGKFEFSPSQVSSIKAVQQTAGSPLFHAVFASNGKPVGTTRTQQALSLTRSSVPTFRLESLSNGGVEQATAIGKTLVPSKQRQRVSIRVRVVTNDSMPVPRARVIVYDRSVNEPDSWETPTNGLSSGYPEWTALDDAWTYVVGKGATGSDGTALLTGTVAIPIPDGARRFVMVRVIVSDTESVVRQVAVNPKEVRSITVALSEIPESLTIFHRIDALQAAPSNAILSGPMADLLTKLTEPNLPEITERHIEAYRFAHKVHATFETAHTASLFAMAYASRPTEAVYPQPGFTCTQPVSAASLESYVKRADAEGLIHNASPAQIVGAAKAFVRFVNSWDASFYDMNHPEAMVRYAYFALAKTGSNGFDTFLTVLTNYALAGREVTESFWSEVAIAVDWGATGRPALEDFRGIWEHYALFEYRIDVLQKWYGVALGTALTTPISSAGLATRDELAGKTDTWWSTVLFTPPGVGPHVFDSEYVARVRRSYDERVPTLAVVQRLSNDPTFGGFDNQDGEAASWLTGLHNGSIAFGRDAIRARTLLEESQDIPEIQEANLLALERLLRVRWDLEVVSRLWSLGYRSASEIAKRLRADFVAQLTPVGGAALANEVFESAASIVGKVIDGVKFGQSLQASGVDDHVANATDIGQYFDAVTGHLGQLTRASSPETCESCNSVLGPAAYLLDLLSFLQEATVRSITPSSGPPISLVLAGPFAERRPNVYAQVLSCEAVNSPVPLVQILNEELTRVIGPAALPVPLHSVSRWPWNAAPSESTTRMKAWESALLFRVADAVSLRATAMFAEDTIHPVSLGYAGNFTTNAGWQEDQWRLLETRLGLHFPVVSMVGGGHEWIQPGLAAILPPSLVCLDSEVLSHDSLTVHVFGNSHTEKHRIAELHTFRRTSGLTIEQVQELLQLPAFAATEDKAALQLARVRGDFAVASDDIRGFDITVMQRTEELPLEPAIDALSDTDILNLYRFVTLHHATKLSFSNLGAGLYWTGLLDPSEHGWTPTALHGLAALLSISDALQTSVDVVATWFSPDLTAIPAIGKANAESGLTRWQEVFGTLDPGTDTTKDSVLDLTALLKTSLGLSHGESTAFFQFIASPEDKSRRGVLQTAYRFASLARALRLPFEVT